MTARWAVICTSVVVYVRVLTKLSLRSLPQINAGLVRTPNLSSGLGGGAPKPKLRFGEGGGANLSLSLARQVLCRFCSGFESNLSLSLHRRR